jgi:hypothetical protein
VKADDRHYSLVAELVRDGLVIPFLGAGANLCDRPEGAPWEVGSFTPSGGELAHRLAERSFYPQSDELELARVSQYVDAILGEGRLYGYLHEVFDADYPLTSLHLLLARIPALLRERARTHRPPPPQLLILTTNYDDLVERALEAAGEPFDVVWYEAKQEAPARGRFLHRRPDGDVVEIAPANKYDGLDPDERPVVLKLHGAIDRLDAKRDSYVITEDSYIDYLAGGDVGEQIPFSLRARMADSHFLFLGYSMRDWNLRVILNRIWGSDLLHLRSWAVQREPTDEGVRDVEEALWRARGDVNLVYVPLGEYVARLRDELFPDEPTDE